MSQRNNFIAQKFLEQNLAVNPVEDGNTPFGLTNQGTLSTSEINNSDYIGAYEGFITSAVSGIDQTGNNNYFKIKVAYEVDDYRRGWFGSKLIKEGDPFIIEATQYVSPFNPIKGYVVNVISIEEKMASTGVYEYIYELYCSLTDGDFASINPTTTFYVVPGWALDGYTVVGQKFRNDRRVFSYKSEKTPIPKDTVYDANTGNLILYWEDPTNLAVGYRLCIRNEDKSSINYYTVPGNSPNFNGNLSCVLSTSNPDQLGAIKIENQGSSMSLSVIQPTFVCAGTAPSANVYLDKCGKVEITSWDIFSVNSLTANQGNFTIKLKGEAPVVPITLSSNNFYVNMNDINIGDSYVYGVTNVWGNNAFDINIQFLKPLPSGYVANSNDVFLRKTILLHTGIDLTYAGIGLTKPPKLTYDKYPTGSKYSSNNLSFVPNSTYYWSVSSVYDCDQKTFSEWSQETKIST